MATYVLTYVVFVFTVMLFPETSVSVSQQVLSKTLHDYLFTDYDSNLIPLCTSGSNVTLSMDVALRQVMDVNERDQLLTANVWIRLRWNDCRLTWDPASYNGSTYITVKYIDVWFPDITLYDSAAEEVMFPGKEDYRVSISSTGSVSYNFPTVTKSVCRVNVQYFPFDTQRCSLQFGSWSHHGLELDVINRNQKEITGDIETFIQNPEWNIKDFPVERHVLYYNCCPEPYPDITFYVVIERRPAFYLLTMMFPCILVSAVAAVGFLLPVESGEKVSLGITVLLSLAVFLLVVSESLPPSSDNFPIIGSYFAASMVLVSLSLLQTVVILNVFYRGTTGRRVPRWAKIVFFQYIGKFVCSNSNKIASDDPEAKFPEKSPPKLEHHINVSDNHKDDDMKHSPENNDTSEGTVIDHEPKNGRLLPAFAFKDPMINSVKEQTNHLKSIDQYFKDGHHDAMVMSEWRDLSNILDRLFLFIYSLITVITTLSFLLQCVIQ